MRHYFLLVVSWLVRTITIWLPEAAFISRFRGALYGLFLSQCGKNFQVSSNVRIINLENFSVGDDVYLAPGVIVNAISSIHLDSEVMVGFNCVLVSGNHTLFNESYRFGRSSMKPIKIGAGTWVAANCTVTAGAEVGYGSLVGANSVVNGVLPPLGRYGGIPAKSLD
jgi:maltose O-acetyltransferase